MRKRKEEIRREYKVLTGKK